MAKASERDLKRGETLVEEKRSRIEAGPPEPDFSEKKCYCGCGGPRVESFWDYQLHLTPERWKEHVISLYRMKDGERGSYIAQFCEPISEEKIRSEFGGGKFSILMRRGSMMIYSPTFEVEGAPKVRMEPTATGQPAGNGDVNAQVLMMLRETLEEMRKGAGAHPLIQNAAADALTIQRTGFENALHTIRETTKAAGGGFDESPVVKLLMPVVIAMLTKAIEPRDQMQEIAKMMETMKSMSGTLGLAPATKGGDNTALLLQQVPAALDRIAAMVRDYRMAAEAQARARGVNIPAQPAPTAAATPVPLAAGTPTPPPPSAEEVAVQIIETKIAEIILDTQQTTEEAAEEAYLLLLRLSPRMVEQLLMMNRSVGMEQVAQFLAGRPLLAQAATHARFKDFVRLFLSEAASDAAPVAASGTQPPA